MNKKIIIAAISLMFGVSIVIPVFGNADTIVLVGADETNTFLTTPSQSLITQISNVGTRFVLEYSLAKHEYLLTTPPSGLLTLIQQVADRFIVHYALSIKFIPVSYPKSIINDTAPPQVITTSTEQTAGVVHIYVTVNEYSTCTLNLGPSPGNYTQTIEDDLFDLEHEFSVTGLTVEATYYYRFTCSDRSDNITQSSEYSFTVVEQKEIYLPVIQR